VSFEDHIENPQLITAKVPILKFCDVQEGIEIDLNCNNAVGIRNTHLLYCYTRRKCNKNSIPAKFKLSVPQLIGE